MVYRFLRSHRLRAGSGAVAWLDNAYMSTLNPMRPKPSFTFLLVTVEILIPGNCSKAYLNLNDPKVGIGLPSKQPEKDIAR